MKYEDMSPPETFVFFREGFFYPVEIPVESIADNAALNPGTLRVEDLCGRVMWSHAQV